MSLPPQRYFARSLPFRPDSDNSSDDDSASSPALVAPPPPSSSPPPSRVPANPPAPRRRRIAARVVDAAPTPRGTASGFVRVDASLSANPSASPAVAAPPSDSHSSSSSSASASGSGSGSGSGSDADSSSPRDSPASEIPPPSTTHPVFLPSSAQSISSATTSHPAHATSTEAQHDVQSAQARRTEAQRLLTLALQEDDRRRDVVEHEIPQHDDREEDHDADYALWRVRELLRIRRQRQDDLIWMNKRGTT